MTDELTHLHRHMTIVERAPDGAITKVLADVETEGFAHVVLSMNASPDAWSAPGRTRPGGRCYEERVEEDRAPEHPLVAAWVRRTLELAGNPTDPKVRVAALHARIREVAEGIPDPGKQGETLADDDVYLDELMRLIGESDQPAKAQGST